MNDYGMGDFFKKSFEMQQNMAKAWTGVFNPSAAGKAADDSPLSAMTKMYQGIYEAWQKQFLDNPWMKLTPWNYNLFNSENTVFDMFNKMMNSGKGVADLADVWQQLAGKDPFKTRDEILKFIEDNKTAFEKLFRDFISPFVPDNLRPLVNNAVELVKLYESTGKDFTKSWLELGPKTADDFKKIMEGDTSAYAGFYKRVNEAYNESYGKLFNATGIGLTREQNEEIMSQFDSFFKMIISLTELMSLLADVSRENMVAVIEAYQRNVAEGKQPESLKEFYDLWVKINEESFVKVFGTPLFSRIFCDFAKRSCEFKIHFDKVLEQTLGWAPFPKNSDMSSLYKTVYDLRKSDYQNTKLIAEMREELDALRAAAGKPTDSKKGDK
jgi:hypothetical protein